jgi:hypothetical protein
MADHPKESDPKGVNPSGQGPAQPRKTDEAGRADANQPGARTADPKGQAGAGKDTYD